MCVLIFTSFTAQLTTRLASATYKPLSSLEEAINKGYKISVIKGTMQHQSIVEVRVYSSRQLCSSFCSHHQILVLDVLKIMLKSLNIFKLFIFCIFDYLLQVKK